MGRLREWRGCVKWGVGWSEEDGWSGEVGWSAEVGWSG